MQLTIALPGLCWLDIGDLEYLYQQTTTPNLATVIKHAAYSELDYSYSEFLYSLNNNTNHTLADKLAHDLNVSHEYPYFLLAEPCHLRLDRDRLIITEPELLQLTNVEAINFITEINQYFAGELKLYYHSDELWLIGHKIKPEQYSYFPIQDIAGDNINDYLSSNNVYGLNLAKIMNETQMLLFNHPANKSRTEEGSLTLNSIWLSNVQFNTQAMHNKYTKIYSNPHPFLPEHATILPIELNLQTIGDNTLMLVDNLYSPCRYRDSFDWIKQLEYVDATVGKLLKQHLSMSILNSLTILIPGSKNTQQLTINRLDRIKFWRKTRLIDINKEIYAF